MIYKYLIRSYICIYVSCLVQAMFSLGLDCVSSHMSEMLLVLLLVKTINPVILCTNYDYFNFILKNLVNY